MSVCRQTRSKSRQALAHSAFPSSSSRTGLPAEIINNIFNISPLEARVKVVRLNRWFNTVFGALLYQDIRISTPCQLLKLYRSKKISKKLAATRKLTMARRLLWEEHWKDVPRRLEPIEYLCRVLQMTTSLVELNILDLNDKFELAPWSESVFMKEICKRALSPSFLPRLARFRYSSAFGSLQSLYYGRPLEHIELGVPRHNSKRNPAILHHPAGLSPSRLSLSTTFVFWPDDTAGVGEQVADHLQQSIVARLAVKHLSVFVCSITLRKEIFDDNFEQLLLAWVRGFLSKGGGDQLESLGINISCWYGNKPLGVQHRVVEGIGKFAPNLAYGVVGYPNVQWRRNVSKEPSASSVLPEWTPCPAHRHPDVLRWWLEVLKIHLPDTPSDQDADVAVAQMRKAMVTRWADGSVPPLESLRARILGSDLDPTKDENSTCTIA